MMQVSARDGVGSPAQMLRVAARMYFIHCEGCVLFLLEDQHKRQLWVRCSATMAQAISDADELQLISPSGRQMLPDAEGPYVSAGWTWARPEVFRHFIPWMMGVKYH